MTRRNLAGTRVIVTGASGGIGRALAIGLARGRAQLLITARRAERLAAVQSEIESLGADAVTVVGDLTCEETRRQVCQSAQEHWGGLDILVNNAGVGALGRFDTASPDRLRQIMELNFFAPVELIRLALPLLKRGIRPIITNISSVLGHRAVPNRSEYCASKFALHGFSDALRAELSQSGIDVLLVSPSTTNSEFFEHVLENRAATKSVGRALSPAQVARRNLGSW